MVSSLRHVQCDGLRDQKDYSVLVHFLSFLLSRRVTALTGFAGELNCEAVMERGERWLVLLPRREQHEQHAVTRG